MQLAPFPTAAQLRSSFVALDATAAQLGSLALGATTSSTELLDALKGALDAADVAATSAVSFEHHEALGVAARQAREGIEALYDMGDTARDALRDGFDAGAMLDVRRVANGLRELSRIVVTTVDEFAGGAATAR